jgi:hypothetical protein
LNIISTLGDANKDGKYEELYAFGGRSFTIWNGDSGSLVFDSKNDLTNALMILVPMMMVADDKETEPESVVVAKMGSKDILVGLEKRITVWFMISNPKAPIYLQTLKMVLQKDYFSSFKRVQRKGVY